jgi:hypothetical protein
LPCFTRQLYFRFVVMVIIKKRRGRDQSEPAGSL